MWNLRYAPAAVAGIYQIPRGAAAEITAAIHALQQESLPYGASPEPTGKPNSYILAVAGYVITYERIEAGQIVKLLSIEEA